MDRATQFGKSMRTVGEAAQRSDKRLVFLFLNTPALIACKTLHDAQTDVALVYLSTNIHTSQLDPTMLEWTEAKTSDNQTSLSTHEPVSTANYYKYKTSQQIQQQQQQQQGRTMLKVQVSSVTGYGLERQDVAIITCKHIVKAAARGVVLSQASVQDLLPELLGDNSQQQLLTSLLSPSVSGSASRSRMQSPQVLKKYRNNNALVLEHSHPGLDALQLMIKEKQSHAIVLGEDSSVLGFVDALSLSHDVLALAHSARSALPTRRTWQFWRATAASKNQHQDTEVGAIAKVSVSLNQTNTLHQVTRQLALNETDAVPIVSNQDPKHVVGIVSCSDMVFRVLAVDSDPNTAKEQQAFMRDLQVRLIMTSNPVTVPAKYTVVEALQRMQAQRFRHLPVMNNDDIAIVNCLQVAAYALQDAYTLLGINEMTTIAHALNVPEVNPLHLFEEDASIAYASPRVLPTLSQNPSRSSTHLNASSSLSSSSALKASTKLPLSPLKERPSIIAPELAIDAASSETSTVIVASKSTSQDASLTEEVGLPFKLEYPAGVFCRFKLKRSQLTVSRLKTELEKRFEDIDPSSELKLRYLDEDQDEVIISCDDDLKECAALFDELEWTVVRLKVIHGIGTTSRPLSSVSTPIKPEPSKHAPSSSVPTTAAPATSAGPIATATPTPLLSSINFSGLQSQLQALQQKQQNMKLARVDTEKEANLTATTILEGTTVTDEKEEQSGELDLASSDAVHLSNEGSQGVDIGFQNDDLQVSIDRYTEILKKEPTNCQALSSRASAFLIMGDSASAERDYKAALVHSNQLDKDLVDGCYSGLAEALIDFKRFEDAFKYAMEIHEPSMLSGTIQVFIEELESQLESAKSLNHRGDFADALSFAVNCVRLNSILLDRADVTHWADEPLTKLERAIAYQGLNDLKSAKEDVDYVLSKDPHSEKAKALAEKVYGGLGIPMLRDEKREKLTELQALLKTLKL